MCDKLLYKVKYHLGIYFIRLNIRLFNIILFGIITNLGTQNMIYSVVLTTFIPMPCVGDTHVFCNCLKVEWFRVEHATTIVDLETIVPNSKPTTENLAQYVLKRSSILTSNLCFGYGWSTNKILNSYNICLWRSHKACFGGLNSPSIANEKHIYYFVNTISIFIS